MSEEHSISRIHQKIAAAAQDRHLPHSVKINIFPDICNSTGNENDFLLSVGENHIQGLYLYHYLNFSYSSIVLSEKSYHDWEFASQFQVYYGANSSGYPNLCGRHHYFSMVPSIYDAIGNGSDFINNENDFINSLFSGFYRWCCKNFLGTAEVAEISYEVLCTLEQKIKDKIFLLMTGERSKSVNTLFCSLREQRRLVQRNILDSLMKKHDQIILRCGADSSGVRGCVDHSDISFYFKKCRSYDYFVALINGLQDLYKHENSCLFGFDSLIHLFRGMPSDGKDRIAWMEKTIALASAGYPVAKSLLQECYLGYVVERPLPHAPIGSTVLRLPSFGKASEHLRVVNAIRKYNVNLLGISLNVFGLGWQQQDATGACASQALWSALQAHIYNQRSPSSPVITILANKFHAAGQRTFPSLGLNFHNLAEAIRAQEGLAPLVIDGDLTDVRGGVFTREKFNILVTSMLYGGFPVMVFGEREEHDDKHVICLTGFHVKKPTQQPNSSSFCISSDYNIETYYGHDVSIGSNVKFKISAIPVSETDTENKPDNREYVTLKYSGLASTISREGFMDLFDLPHGTVIEPSDHEVIRKIQEKIKADSDARSVFQKVRAYDKRKLDTVNYFEPENIVVALPRQIRSNPHLFHEAINGRLWLLAHAVDHLEGLYHEQDNGQRQNFWPYRQKLLTLTFSIRYVLLDEYLEQILQRDLPRDPVILSQIRRNLLEKVRHMPDYICLLRIGIILDKSDNSAISDHLMMDVIFDTTESDKNSSVFATIKFLSVSDDVIFLYKKFAENYSDGQELFGKITKDDMINLKDFGSELEGFSPNFEPKCTRGKRTKIAKYFE